jgi:hypothetical protein
LIMAETVQEFRPKTQGLDAENRPPGDAIDNSRLGAISVKLKVDPALDPLNLGTDTELPMRTEIYS